MEIFNLFLVMGYFANFHLEIMLKHKKLEKKSDTFFTEICIRQSHRY